jgi:hypothetical protein
MQQAQEKATTDLATFKKGGQPKRKKRRVRVIGQATGIPQYSTKPTARQNIPEGAVRWDPEKDGYDRNQVQAGDYILQDGRYRKVTGFKKKAYEGDFKDERLGDLQSDYGLLQEKMADPKIRAELVKRYRETMKNVKPNAKTGLKQEDIDAAAAMSDDEIIDNFMRKEKQVYALGNKYKNSEGYDPTDAWDKGATREQHAQEMKDLGFEPLSTAETAAFQAVYSDLQKMADDPEFKSDLRDFNVAQIGLGDEPGAGTGKATISDIDGWDGNTTSGQAVLAKDSEMETAEVPMIEPDTPKEEIVQEVSRPDAPWFKQDKIQLASDLGTYFGIEKDKVWRPGLHWKPATPALTDFRGTAARIQSTAQGAMERSAPFLGGNPGQMLAANMEIQRQAANPTLQAQEAEYRANQAIVNDFEKFNTQGLNAFQMAKANWDAERYRDQLEAHRRFKNAKGQAWQNIVNTTKQGITNAAYAQALNLATPQFHMDPRSGGRVRHTGIAKDLDSQASQGPSAAERMQQLIKENPNLTEKQINMVYEQEYGKPVKQTRQDQMAPLLGALPPMFNRSANPTNARQQYRYRMGTT